MTRCVSHMHRDESINIHPVFFDSDVSRPPNALEYALGSTLPHLGHVVRDFLRRSGDSVFRSVYSEWYRGKEMGHWVSVESWPIYGRYLMDSPSVTFYERDANLQAAEGWVTNVDPNGWPTEIDVRQAAVHDAVAYAYPHNDLVIVFEYEDLRELETPLTSRNIVSGNWAVNFDRKEGHVNMTMIERGEALEKYLRRFGSMSDKAGRNQDMSRTYVDTSGLRACYVYSGMTDGRFIISATRKPTDADERIGGCIPRRNSTDHVHRMESYLVSIPMACV